MGYTSSSSSLEGPDHPLSTTLSTDEVKHTISSCKPQISFESNLPQITLALAPFYMNLLLPQIVQIPETHDNFKPLHFHLLARGVLGGVRLLLLPLDEHGLPRLGQPLQSSGVSH